MWPGNEARVIPYAPAVVRLFHGHARVVKGARPDQSCQGCTT